MFSTRDLKTWIAEHRLLSLLIALLAAILLAAGLRLLPASNHGGPDRAGFPAATVNAPNLASGPDPTASTGDATASLGGAISTTADPDVFARSVAQAVFTWDTTGSSLPDLTERLLVVADPTGEETPGLLVDLRTYLPSPKAWTYLGQYQTRQWIEVTDVVEPDAWSEALARAPEGAVASGTTARTVTGVRHRAGTWDGEPSATRAEVQFTIFLVCGPTCDQCHLLRLSTPGLALL